MKIHSVLKEYEVVFTSDPKSLSSILDNSEYFYVIDANVFKLHRKLFEKINDKNLYVFDAVEQKKNIDSVVDVLERLLAAGLKRSSTLVSVGGGITQDVTGLVSSIYFRGINWTYLPTTLLAQSDSCIGGKTSLNHHNYKNVLGSFYPPDKIYVHSGFLNTLKTQDHLSGVGEVVKLFLIKGKDGFKEIKKDISKLVSRDESVVNEKVIRSLEVKKAYIEEDEFDMGRRNVLNFGHTFGHVIESLSNYEISHGQAIVFGMDVANIISAQRGLLDLSLRDEIKNAVFDPIVTTDLSKYLFDVEKMLSLLKKDKKRVNNNYSFILMDRDFNFNKYNDIKEEEIQKALKVIL